MAAAGAQDHGRWATCVVALSRLPAVGEEVYYFPQGHADQFSLAAQQADQRRFPCTITAIHLFTAGAEPYARISLLPAAHRIHPAADTRPNPDSFLYFPKALVQSDVQRTSFTVPKVCVESLFPDLEVGNDTQTIVMSGLDGEVYQFEHRLAGRKNELKGDWARFVVSKGWRVDDTVLFIRRSDMSFLIGARRVRPVADHELQQPLEELAQSSQLAAEGGAFTVTYYPGMGSGSPFVVPRGAVDEAMRTQWDAGMEVRIRPSDLVLHAEDPHGATLVATPGRIRAVTPALVWKNLQIDLDGSLPSTTKSMWEVVPIPAQPPAAKRSKTTADAGLPGEEQSKEHVKKPKLMGFTITTKDDTGTC